MGDQGNPVEIYVVFISAFQFRTKPEKKCSASKSTMGAFWLEQTPQERQE